MIFSVCNAALIYACLAATAITSPVVTNDDPHLKPPTRAIPKAALESDPLFSKGLNIVNQEQECGNVPGWQDSLGYSCDDYAKSFYYCYLFGSGYENDGYTANETYCCCGGGNVGGGGDDDFQADDDDVYGGGTGGGVVYGLQPSCNSKDSDTYNMCLDLESLSGSYESWMEAFAKAKLKWEGIIVGDLASFSSSELPDDPEFRCTGYSTAIDDVYLCGRKTTIDGPGGVLGSAAPLSTRGSGVVNPRTGEEYSVTFSGLMEFDSDDIADLQSRGEFEEVVLHEMGHIIGAGTLWVTNGLYTDGSGEYASGTRGCSGPLPVEQDGGAGTADGHWDEECLQHEMMSGFLSGSAQPISKIAIGSFKDMGYLVDISQADPFTTVDLEVCSSFCPEAARRGLRQRERKVRAKLDIAGEDAIMRYVKIELTKMHKEFEIAAVLHGDRDDGFKAVEELHVLYKDAGDACTQFMPHGIKSKISNFNQTYEMSPWIRDRSTESRLK